MIIPLQVPDGTKRIHAIIVHRGEDGEEEYESETIYVDTILPDAIANVHNTVSYVDTLRQLITKG